MENKCKNAEAITDTPRYLLSIYLEVYVHEVVVRV
jgi:hypothetical protein